MSNPTYHRAEFKTPTFEVAGSLEFVAASLQLPDAVATPRPIRNWDMSRGALLAVGIKSDQGFDVIGTAFMLGPGIAISARHIFVDIEGELSRGTKAIYLLGIHSKLATIWNVRHLNVQDERDICVLSLEPFSELPTHEPLGRFVISTREPKRGERVLLVGFRRSQIEIKENSVFVGAQLLGSAGIVNEVYFPHRDSVIAPFPAIQIEAGSLGGMSGGIVLDEWSRVLGVISSGFDAEEDDGPTFAAWIIECLGRKITYAWPPGIYADGTALLEAPKAAAVIHGLAAVSLNAKGKLEYKRWSENPETK